MFRHLRIYSPRLASVERYLRKQFGSEKPYATPWEFARALDALPKPLVPTLIDFKFDVFGTAQVPGSVEYRVLVANTNNHGVMNSHVAHADMMRSLHTIVQDLYSCEPYFSETTDIQVYSGVQCSTTLWQRDLSQVFANRETSRKAAQAILGDQLKVTLQSYIGGTFPNNHLNTAVLTVHESNRSRLAKLHERIAEAAPAWNCDLKDNVQAYTVLLR
jgi:hypothetical protein